jgi:hypothetical protein
METLKPKNKGSGGSSTQKYVDVDDIRDGVIVLKSGALRSVLLVSSVNFDLKSSQEQDAIITQYQNFLNSLDFPVQIVISSRRFNIDPYIALLDEQEKQQPNELLRFQISEYKNFVRNLTDVSNIMSKFFYVVVPFAPSEDQKSGFLDKMLGIFQPKKAVSISQVSFDTYRSQLLQRVDHVTAALSSTGVRVTQLGTKEVIELLYNAYNPSLFTTAVIEDVDSVELAPISRK